MSLFCRIRGKSAVPIYLCAICRSHRNRESDSSRGHLTSRLYRKPARQDAPFEPRDVVSFTVAENAQDINVAPNFGRGKDISHSQLIAAKSERSGGKDHSDLSPTGGMAETHRHLLGHAGAGVLYK